MIIIQLSGCQNGTQFIAGTFNVSTKIQKQFIDRHAPHDVIVHSNISYSKTPTLTLDLYQPSNIAELAPRPTIIWIHGGGWIAGSKEHARGYFKRLAEQGYNVVAIQYQFAPQAIYPTQLLQIDQALQFLTQHAEQYHINAEQFYLAGDSAGANLASHYAALVTNPNFAQASQMNVSLKSQQLKGLILHCGIYDLQSFVQTAPNEMKILEWGIYHLVQAYTGDKKDDLAFLSSISPRQHVTSNFPPVFISGGNHDFLTQGQSLPFVETLQRQGVPVTTAFYPDSKELLVHEYQFMMSKKASQKTLTETIQFLKRYSPEASYTE